MQRDADHRGFVILDVDPFVVGGVHRRHGWSSLVDVWGGAQPRK
jgi:hypothetical protein